MTANNISDRMVRSFKVRTPDYLTIDHGRRAEFFVSLAYCSEKMGRCTRAVAASWKNKDLPNVQNNIKEQDRVSRKLLKQPLFKNYRHTGALVLSPC